MRTRPGDVVAFLGPSLAAAEAARIAPCRVLPPARAGDVLAVLPERPLAIALVDGVFESTPSVWHHELLAALDAGVAVFGASSMGALRAAELWRHGVVGVGDIFDAYRRGLRTSDADVALLHAGPEHGYRAMTVPLVAAEAAARAAGAAGVLARHEAAALARAARATSWLDRTWARALDAAGLSAAARDRFRAFLPRAPDPKADDARACLRAAAAFAAARRRGAPPPPRPARAAGAVARLEPAHVRRRRLDVAACALPDGATVPAAEVLAALARRPDAGRLAADGLRRAAVAALARTLGLRATADDVAAAERAWMASLGVRPRDRDALLAACGLDDGAARRLAEDLALDAALLGEAERLLPDGPSREEGLALAARLSGAWLEAALPDGAAPPRRRRRRVRRPRDPSPLSRRRRG